MVEVDATLDKWIQMADGRNGCSKVKKGGVGALRRSL